MISLFKGCLAALLLSTVASVQAQTTEISNARIIQPPPGAKVAAAYFTIDNNTDEALVITGASSDTIPKVSIHLSAVIDDVAKMIPQNSVTIDAGESLEFKHGSYHIMLMGLKAPLMPGKMVALELNTSAGILPIMVPIITPDQASGTESHTMDHGSMKHNSKDETLHSNNADDHSGKEENTDTASDDHSDSRDNMKHNDMKHGDTKAPDSMDKN